MQQEFIDFVRTPFMLRLILRRYLMVSQEYTHKVAAVMEIASGSSKVRVQDTAAPYAAPLPKVVKGNWLAFDLCL